MDISSWVNKSRRSADGSTTVTERCQVEIEAVRINVDNEKTVQLRTQIFAADRKTLLMTQTNTLREGDRFTITHLFTRRKVWKPDLPQQNTQDIKVKFGEFNNVLLTNAEYSKLQERLGIARANDLIERLSAYLASKNKRYASHYATLLNWERRAKENQVGKNRNPRILPQTYTKSEEYND